MEKTAVTRGDPTPDNALGAYAPSSQRGDLYAGAQPNVAAKWETTARRLLSLSQGAHGNIQEQVARESQELGLTFRLIGDEDERPWPLSPMPLLIGTEEWDQVAQGLIQRASLLESIVADIYGPQRLVAEGHLPAAVISGSSQFVPKMVGIKPSGGHYLHVYAADLARGPNGEWRVLADRTRFATGIGYALENRLALSRSTGSLLSDINTRRHAGFYGDLRRGIAADNHRDEPRIALLTAGPYNQSYPEQAHLARYLGLPLVEGRDLTVISDQLFVRTIAGPKRIDAIWRWINARQIDPLAFDSHSQIGIPDLFQAWSNGGLTVANWPGVGVVESHAFSAFMPRLATKLLGSPLKLPNVATWWCGQETEASTVKARFEDLVISSAFGGHVKGLPAGRTRAGAQFSEAEKDTLLAAMQLRPIDYCGQEIVHLSTSPVLVDDQFVPRPFTLRAFVARDGDGNWQVMPGGFARLSSSGDLRTSLMGDGDLSADVCVVDDVPIQQESLLGAGESPPILRSGGILASQAADNLFWFSRYAERAEMTVRVIRSLAGSPIDVDGGAGRGPDTIARLVDILVQWGAIKAEQARSPVIRICGSAFAEKGSPGGVAALIGRTREIGRGLRDRMSTDFWRVANRPVPSFDADHSESLLNASNMLIERLSTLSGLTAENMVRSPAWRFLELGRRLERALNCCRLTRQFAFGDSRVDDLGALLDLCDSQIVYRTRYLTGPMQVPVIDLVLLDPNNPRSLLFQLNHIEEHLANLPLLVEDGVPERPLRETRAMLADLLSLEAAGVTEEAVQEVEVRLLSLSEALSQRYFLQVERPDRNTQGSLLG
ncbi:circularly permuted type 2 ATP-grasp protein [Alteraurantiacibacter aestuarii]|uniref:DUF403 domain-containing protein n=1 Tax=Alteraurantiacibacter aestuarii TaxID=650004 RepID=A0A844ZJR8_9SPHN|nr:circularly permuted type 2 ATP-grasp protein [Alteraurantiacibacter aestuarii]MXO88701.1 hypothetical protein [Alteraurantiacibacter aestuarii]